MSEFTYACPVCSQHIRCDYSQAGSTMTCPTCFQKIIVPQAPADAEQKLILTGTKVGDRPAGRNPELNPYAAPESKRVSGVFAVLAIFLFIGLAVGFVYRGTILKPSAPGKPGSGSSAGTGGSSGSADEGNPSNFSSAVKVPPIASDTNWQMNLKGVTIPDSTAVGRIHGQDFEVDRAVFSHGALVLRTGRKGPVTFGVSINFHGAQAGALAGKSLNILADTNKSALVTLHWQDDDSVGRNSYDVNYALRLEFGSLSNRYLPGRIYLCTPDPQKSYVMGTFDAEVPTPKGEPK